MELESRPDFEAVRSQWDDFWQGRRDAPMVSVVADKPGVEPVSKPDYMAGADGDFDAPAERVLGWARTHEFLGASVPSYSIEFGPDHFAMLLGAERVTRDASSDTAWVEPFVQDWSDAEIRFRPDGRWWVRTAEFAQALRARCDGVALIGAPTLVANLDALSAIRGPERLMEDLAERPEEIRAALGKVGDAYREILDAFAELLDYPRFGSVTRHGLYSRGRTNVPQCDCSCMISPGMFRELAVPALRREMQALDAVEYHLDGPGALRHLEALCSIPELDVIQWVAGAGDAATQDWTELHVRIDRLGKGQYLPGDIDELVRLRALLRSRKIVFSTHARSRDEGLRLIDRLASGR